MAYYVLEVRNADTAKIMSRDTFNTKKAALRAYSKIKLLYRDRPSLRVSVRYYPS